MRRIPYAEAKFRGLTYFFTGEPCSNGHTARLRVHTKECVECERQRSIKAWIERPKDWLQRTLEDRGKKKKKPIPAGKIKKEVVHHSTLARMTIRQQNIALATPYPVECPICDLPNERWVLDHDHKTKLFRGFVCGHCNTLLGFAKDNPEALMRAALYLKRHNSKNAPEPDEEI